MTDEKQPPAESVPEARDRNQKSLEPADDSRTLAPSPLELAGRAANRAAGRHAQIPLVNGADFMNRPAAWEGVTWGIVEGFVQWQLQEGYAVSTVNARLTTIRVYAEMAAKAGYIDPREAVLIKSVKGFSRQGGLNVDERREEADVPTRIDEVTYAYKPEGARRTKVVTRRSTKKERARLLSDEEAEALKQLRSQSPQGYRDALLLCLLLDHGLRASEAALLTIGDFDLGAGELTFYRPKVKGTDQEWATHKLTPETAAAARTYIFEEKHPTPLLEDAPLLLATTRLLNDGSGGDLIAGRPLSRVRISERVKWLGRQSGMPKLAAHDCRHYCATKMARLGYGVDELMAWFGWTSAQTAVRYIAAAEVQERHKG